MQIIRKIKAHVQNFETSKHESFAILHLKVTSSVIPKSLAFSKIFTY